jgi:hypothetical protein
MRILRYSAAEQDGVPLTVPENGVFTIEHMIGLLGKAGISGAEITADPSVVTDITPSCWATSDARYLLSRQKKGGPVTIDLMSAQNESTTVRNIDVAGQTGEELTMTRTPLRTITVPGAEGPFVLAGPSPNNPGLPHIHELIVQES